MSRSCSISVSVSGRKLLILDWGGGTIDVTLLDYDGKHFEELSSRGITALGGLEFDETLARIVLEKGSVRSPTRCHGKSATDGAGT
ncbi:MULTISPECIES: Hsp70 family protein [Streptomyces]|uniref:Hsp70 family protein n=1 Tax=Streptomyces TaxID=1883 RepID=UPI00130290E2